MSELSPTDSITKTVLLDAPLARVWHALTDHAAFGAWFGVKLDAAFAVGAPQSGHITHKGHEHLAWHARTVAIEPMRRFAFTWHPYAIDPDMDYSGETPTTVTFTLTPEGEGTRLTVVESGFDRVPAHRRAEAFRMNDGGWAQQMKNIAAYVTAGG